MSLEPSTLGPMSDLHKMSFNRSADRVQDNVNKCMECYQSCQQLILHCLQLGGEYAESPHIKLLQDCSALTATLAKFMLRGSSYINKLSVLCQEVCLDCAADCDRMNDDMMKACARVCRRCAESLEKMDVAH